MIITLDIETIPTARPDVIEHIKRKIAPPGNISKAETIAAWEETQRPIAEAEAIHKTGLNGAFGRVVCTGLALDAADPETLCGLDERHILLDTNDVLDQVPMNQRMACAIVGHNVAAFDLRFLVQRYIVNQVRPHPILLHAAQAKPWETDKVYDTMLQWAGLKSSISLDDLCLALSLPGKGTMTGADVWPMVQKGCLEEIAEYCADDVVKTRAVYWAMTFAHLERQA